MTVDKKVCDKLNSYLHKNRFYVIIYEVHVILLIAYFNARFLRDAMGVATVAGQRRDSLLPGRQYGLFCHTGCWYVFPGTITKLGENHKKSLTTLEV